MQNQTDLKQVKRVSKILLFTEIHNTDLSPMIVQHPFTSTGITLVSLNPNQILDITKSQDNLEKWRNFMLNEFERAKNITDIYKLVNKPYCLTFLKFALPYLSSEDFSRLLADAWIRSENPNMDPNISKRQMLSMFSKADANYLMEESERKQIEELDEEVTVYRGVTSYNAKNIKALSWTLDYKKAKWFAHRFDEDGIVYEARIRKENILAVFNSRNESEVIVNPYKLQDIKEVPDLGFEIKIT